MAASVPVAAGAALALKYKRLPNVAFCLFGDGATSRGDWHEGLNLAAVLKLPVVYVCNNNQYAYSTPLNRQMACANVADRGPAYGMPAETVDGNDVFAVYQAAMRAAAHARAGLGPYLLECRTFRMTGHSAHDPADYVPKHLWDEWAARDPLSLLERRINDDPLVAETGARVQREVDEAVEWAENSPYPDASDLMKNVYEEK
jgi:pyruvate dehydrogenase E1 component alpha subunit